jgi:acyl-CoA thioester hydrolase
MQPHLIDPIYRYEFTVPPEALDQNGHVNNVQFVQWMQEAAVRHFESVGGVEHTLAIGATWVVRSHTIEYFRPAFAGDTIEVQTWVANIRRVRSLRRYRFLRKTDGQKLVEGATDWVLVNARNGFPLAIPQEVAESLPLLPDEKGK